MAGRTRTTKKLSQRIDREYFKRLFPIPRWRRTLTYLFIGLGVLWLGWHAVARNSTIYNAGPISSAHSMFGQNCSACHVKTAVFSKTVTDQACSQCHDGPIHQASQTYTPACTDCHMEHKGNMELAHTSEKACTDCHSDLKVKSGEIKVAARINSFTDGHPEFKLIKDASKDPGTIKFNHNTHLKKELRGPHGNVMLNCIDCHRPGTNQQPWPFGLTTADAQKAEMMNTTESKPSLYNAVQNPHEHNSSRSYMGPVDFYEHCSSCHPLQFDRRISEPAPHQNPEAVRVFMKKKFEDYIAAHPGDVHEPNTVLAQLPNRPPLPPARNAEEWVSQRLEEAQLLLNFKTCKECHDLKFTSSEAAALPEIPKAKVTTRWMEHGQFDHSAHQMLQCTECHSKAKDSKETSDLLLPGIKECQACHHTGGQNVAKADCYECHQYHDWKLEKPIEGKFTTHELMTRITNHPQEVAVKP